jgi:imidazolonepropionase-like amidohydrolase
MIILDADPLENISNTKTIEAVIADGRLVGRYNNSSQS